MLRSFLSQVRLFNFRNLRDQSVQLHHGPVFITGPNGNGKTNFLEALYLLSGSRSFRTNTASELSRWGTQSSSVFGVVHHGENSEELGIAFHPGRREAFLNGTILPSLTELLGRLCVIAFSPADLQLVKGAPAGRRKFLDRHMVDLQPQFLQTLMVYQRALSNKSAILKTGCATYSQLIPWNQLLVENGGKIVENRIKFLDLLRDIANKEHSSYAPTDGVVHLELESDLVRSDGVVDMEYIAAQFERVAEREVAQRSALIGVQRDDIKITLGGVDSRAFASQGQTRSVVLSLKLAVVGLLEAHTQRTPVVLLDDVDSEIDRARSERLFESLLTKPRQLVVTGTDEPPAALGRCSDLQTIRVAHGELCSC
jgi:DNA replication and repair protein RecF